MLDNKMQRLVVCVEEIRQWMNANRLRLNEDKTQFIWLEIPHQLSDVQCQKISLRGVNIQISTEVTCLGGLLDSKLTFTPHVRRLSARLILHKRKYDHITSDIRDRLHCMAAHSAALGVQDLSADFQVSSPDGTSLP